MVKENTMRDIEPYSCCWEPPSVPRQHCWRPRRQVYEVAGNSSERVKKSRIIRRLLILVAAALPVSGAPLQFSSAAWTVTINPVDLSASAVLPDGRTVPISAPQRELGDASEVVQDATGGHWLLPARRISVAVSLKDQAFNIQFVTDQPGKFAWPISAAPEEEVSYIVPKGEGFVVSPRDPIWLSKAWPQHLDTMADFSLPLWGVMGHGWTLTYLLSNPFDNDFSFRDTGRGVAWGLEHEFKRNWQKKEFGFAIVLGGESPVEPARVFRQRLVDAGQFVSMREKIAKTPDAARLLGAPHAYLWSLGVLGRDDVRDWKVLAHQLAGPDATGVGGAVRKRIGAAAIAELRPVENSGRPSQFQQREILVAFDAVIRDGASPETVGRNKALVYAAFPEAFASVATWGDAVSPKMFEKLRAKGFDRFWLGISGLSEIKGMPEAAAAARKAGFLLGPYDSYDSIHAPGEADTWETAQFDAELFDKGAIVGPDGKKEAGFKKKGYWLSSIAARPYVERRVARTFADSPFNSFFMDCDATGDLRDNYSTAFPATQADDMRERLARMQWVVDQYHVPIGSEGGQWYAAPVIHFAHGMMTPVFGFFDARFNDKASQWFLGGYWPPDAPAIFLKPVPLPDDYRAIYFDPRVRIPLFQTAFHDSVITTHHWSRPSLKFSNVRRTDELLELLYNVPPLYHLSLDELERNPAFLTRHYQFFSPLHRLTALLPMTGFSWVTSDRMVQKTTFGNDIEMIANFRSVDFTEGVRIPAESIVARHVGSGEVIVYSPLP
jgi:hypothetical protein